MKLRGTPNQLQRCVQDFVAIAQPTTVIAPVAFDRHPDHSATADITDAALEAVDLHPSRLGYLVHTGRPKSLVRR